MTMEYSSCCGCQYTRNYFWNLEMKMTERIFRGLLVLIASLLAPSFSTVLQAQTEPPAQMEADYQIGPHDMISITVFQDKELNNQARVGNDGNISMPLLGQVHVGGMTTNEAAARIKSLLESQFMNKADVAVSIDEFNSQPISVFGAVNKPGKVTSGGGMSLIQAISAAGGLSANAPAKNIYVLRNGRNGLTGQLVIVADDLMVKGNPDLNIPLLPNDVVNVLADKQISIYLMGEVMKPGVTQFRESQNATLLQAIAAAGGLTDRANKSSVVIKRKEAGKDEIVRVNLNSIMNGKTADYDLKDNDTIIINESFF
jgi:polysaccharide export outer membrane protein